VLADAKTAATEEQIEIKESRIIDLAHHIILSTALAHLGPKIKDLATAEDM